MTSTLPQDIPTLTEILQPGRVEPPELPDPTAADKASALSAAAWPEAGDMASLVGDELLGSPSALTASDDAPAFEQRLADALMAQLETTLQNRVHASVAPAIAMLADRIAYKAAQEISAELVQDMRAELVNVIRKAVEEAQHQS